MVPTGEPRWTGRWDYRHCHFQLFVRSWWKVSRWLPASDLNRVIPVYMGHELCLLTGKKEKAVFVFFLYVDMVSWALDS